MTQHLVREEFNRWADQGRGQGMEKSHWQITLATLQLMKVKLSDNSLDLGCGAGWATRILAKMAPKGIALGADLADRMILEATRDTSNPSNAHFSVAEASRLPCEANFFDSLLSVESIYYYSDIESALAEAHRVIRPGGQAYFLINFYTENIYSHCWSDYLAVPVQLLGSEEYCDLLRKVGFSKACHRRISDPTPIPDDFKPSQWHPNREAMEAFQQEGALLLVGNK